MAEFRIAVDLSQVMNAMPIITRQVFPLVNQAVRAIAQQTQANWMESVYRARLWSGEKDAYAKSIAWEMTGDFSAVVKSDYKNAEEIDQGRPPYDLKQMLNTSPKVRRTKDGRRFMIIPFRQNTTGQDALTQGMPQDVYDAGSALSASKIVAQTKRVSGELTSIHPTWGTQVLKKQTPFASNIKTRGPMLVNKNIYKWGGKLDTSGMTGLSDAQKKRYNGMVRMTGTTPGGGRYSQFMTFRVMMEGSAGWIIPARPGLNLARNVAAKIQPLAERVINEAVAQSFK
jgi:hypothetical protein